MAVVSHALWERRFGSDPSILGKTIRLDGVETRLVGVMPNELSVPDASTDLWLPLRLDRSRYRDTSFSYNAIGRLRPGVSIEEAETEMGPILRRITETYPGDLTQSMLEQAKMEPVLHALKQDVVGEVETPLWILLGTVGFVLLVAAANVANLFLVRADARHREVAVRTALGASRADIAGLYLTESLALGLLGGTLGLALAGVAVRLFVNFGAMELPRLEDVAIDGAVVLFTLSMSLLAGLLFGLVPILRLESSRLAAGLNEFGRGLTAGRERLSARAVLVTCQVAFALVLLIGSGLMARSYSRLRSVEPGFDPKSTLTFELALPEGQYPGEEEGVRFVRELTEQVGALPGVAAVAITTRLPLSGSYDNNAVFIEDFPVPEGQIPPVHPTRFVSPDYFLALSIPLLEGRAFEWSDRDQGLRTTVVSRAFAEKYWPGQSPIGERLRPFDAQDLYEIIGVVGSVRDEGLDKEPAQTVYFPYGQVGFLPRSLDVAVRTRTEPRALFASIQDEIRRLDKNLPLSGVGTMEQAVARSTARTTFTHDPPRPVRHRRRSPRLYRDLRRGLVPREPEKERDWNTNRPRSRRERGSAHVRREWSENRSRGHGHRAFRGSRPDPGAFESSLRGAPLRPCHVRGRGDHDPRGRGRGERSSRPPRLQSGPGHRPSTRVTERDRIVQFVPGTTTTGTLTARSVYPLFAKNRNSYVSGASGMVNGRTAEGTPVAGIVRVPFRYFQSKLAVTGLPTLARATQSAR